MKLTLKSVPLLWRMTVRAPVLAVLVIEMLKVALVGVRVGPVTRVAVMLLPKSAVRVPVEKLVLTPVKVTGKDVPWIPEVGETPLRNGVLLVTVKPPAKVSVSPPVATVTSWAPTAAVGPTARSASRVVGLLTATLPTLMPDPSETVVAF